METSWRFTCAAITVVNSPAEASSPTGWFPGSEQMFPSRPSTQRAANERVSWTPLGNEKRTTGLSIPPAGVRTVALQPAQDTDNARSEPSSSAATQTRAGWTRAGWTRAGWTREGWTRAGWTREGWTRVSKVPAVIRSDCSWLQQETSRLNKMKNVP